MMRTCKRCGLTFELEFFRLSQPKLERSSIGRRSWTCRRCEQIARDARKEGHGRFIEKARNARSRHAEKFVQAGVIAAKADLEQEFGWELDRMAHEADHTYKNGCPYCAIPFAEMSGGDLSNLTIDIVVPTQPPYWGVNARWVCKTCNRKKARTDPGEWAADQQRWRRAERIINAPRHAERWSDRLFDLDAPRPHIAPPPLPRLTGRIVQLSFLDDETPP